MHTHVYRSTDQQDLVAKKQSGKLRNTVLMQHFVCVSRLLDCVLVVSPGAFRMDGPPT